jgi:SOS-response transcriptional repressor LexA
MANSSITTQKLLIGAMGKFQSQKEMASVLGVTPTYVHEIIHGKKDGKSRLFEFAEKLGINLFDKTEIPERRYKLIPVISWIHAGLFSECIDIWPVGVSGEGEPVQSTKQTGPNTFGLKVIGDSMMPRYLPDDIIIVDPSIRCDNGDPCVVWQKGESTFKFFYETEKEIILDPMNEKHNQIIIKKDEASDFRVIGKVVDHYPASPVHRKIKKRKEL